MRRLRALAVLALSGLLGACEHMVDNSDRRQHVIGESCERLEVIYETERRRSETKTEKVVPGSAGGD